MLPPGRLFRVAATGSGPTLLVALNCFEPHFVNK